MILQEIAKGAHSIEGASIRCNSTLGLVQPHQHTATLKYEPGTIVADGDLVIVHGRFSGFGQPVKSIAANIVRIEDGILVEQKGPLPRIQK